MTGKRLPELVAGDLDVCLHQLWSASAAQVELDLSSSLRQDERYKIISDFEAGRSHLLYLLNAKLAWRKQLPWALAGLGHGDIAVQQRTCRNALEQWDSTLDKTCHHRITANFCAEGSHLRECMIRFLESGVMPFALSLAAAKFAIIDISERKAEQPHAIVKYRKGFHKAGPAAVSTSLRLREWEQIVQDFDGLVQLGSCLESVRTPTNVARALGLLSHPLLRNEDRLRMRSVVAVTYHADATTKYGDNREVVEKQKRLKQVLKPKVQLSDQPPMRHSIPRPSIAANRLPF